VLTWCLDADSGSSSVRDDDGMRVDIASIDALWWRRAPIVDDMPEEVMVPKAAPFVRSNVRAAVLGAFLTEFTGAWVDHPDAIRRAENKLLQLRAAVSAGFRVPRTLVSQDPDRVRRFCEEIGGPVVAKSVAAALGVPALTGVVHGEHLDDEASIRLCPTIYQELVPGDRHLRIHVFGSAVHSALIESDRLDWRYPLDADFSPHEITVELADRLKTVLAVFGLTMGIFDLKLTDDGEPVWFELNPQGQFLFVEALGGGRLLDIFTDFLEAQATQGATAR
jgi:hypothetical protein